MCSQSYHAQWYLALRTLEIFSVPCCYQTQVSEHLHNKHICNILRQQQCFHKLPDSNLQKSEVRSFIVFSCPKTTKSSQNHDYRRIQAHFFRIRSHTVKLKYDTTYSFNFILLINPFSTLPDTMMGSTAMLQLYSLYRNCLADTLLRDRLDLDSTGMEHLNGLE